MTAKSHDNDAGGERTALFPGSFDPFTIGHLDIVRRGLRLFDRVVVAVGYNPEKTSGESLKSRIDRIEQALKGMKGVEVSCYTSLTVDEAKRVGAAAILRGVRSAADYDYERTMAEANERIGGIETVLLVARPELGFISSSLVRELKSFGRDTDEFLPTSD